MTGTPQNHDSNSTKLGDKSTRQGESKRSCAAIAKAGCTITVTNATSWRKINKTIHHGTTTSLIPMKQRKRETKNDGDRGPTSTLQAVIVVAT